MSDRSKFELERFLTSAASFFWEAIFAKLLWNGVGHTILKLPPVTYWQMLGLTMLVALILPRGLNQVMLLQKLVFDKDGKEKP